MSRVKTKLSIAFAGVFLVASVASAQVADRTTQVTFSAPVALPGVTLPAGTYTFKLADSQANRHIVQVFDQEGTKIFATILAIPAERTEVTGETVITFREAPANMPPAVRYWYYPGDKIGQEFAYPKEQAVQIARATGESVLAIDTTSSDVEVMKTAQVTRVEVEKAGAPGAATPATPPAEPTQPTQPATPPAEPTPPTAAPSQPAAPPQQPAAQAAQPIPMPTQPAATPTQPPAPSAATSTPAAGKAERELPKTASELPLVGLVGLLSLAGVFIVRALRRALA